MNARARPLASPVSLAVPAATSSAVQAQYSGGFGPSIGPPQLIAGQNASRGISTLVANELPRSSTLMIIAAVISSLRVLPIRFGRLTSGITATPVSNPDNPSASLGKLISDSAMIAASPAM